MSSLPIGNLGVVLTLHIPNYAKNVENWFVAFVNNEKHIAVMVVLWQNTGRLLCHAHRYFLVFSGTDTVQALFYESLQILLP